MFDKHTKMCVMNKAAFPYNRFIEKEQSEAPSFFKLSNLLKRGIFVLIGTKLQSFSYTNVKHTFLKIATIKQKIIYHKF